jgi:nitric oxide dioxygenase
MELDIKLIQETFELVKPRAEAFAQLFYTRLFQDYPAAQELFRQSSLEKQKRLLIASLVQVVHNLENPEFLGEYVGRMGERHEAFGTTDEHLAWGGATLLKTLEEMLGADWNPTVQQQWAMAYDVFTALMQEGIMRAKSKVVPLPLVEPKQLKKVS